MPARASRPVGTVTRGTTNPNRLRRVDRWVAFACAPLLRGPEGPPLVVDLGYGAAPVTVLELAERLGRVRPDIQVLGLEIDPERVERGRAVADPPRLDFALGGFELPTPRPPVLVRAFNVLRQYQEEEVAGAWRQVVDRLAPGGVLVEGTCDEIGRLAAWVDLRSDDPRGADGIPAPRSLTLSWRLRGLERPGVVAERLPKSLIHHNVPGEGVHGFLAALDAAWARQAPLGAWGARQRFVATVAEVRAAGWPVLHGPARWRLGELGVAWSAVAPGAPGEPGGAAQPRE